MGLTIGQSSDCLDIDGAEVEIAETIHLHLHCLPLISGIPAPLEKTPGGELKKNGWIVDKFFTRIQL
jgi:hypothetical protein